MRIHHCTLKTGITRTREFEKKGLATHAVNVGTKCGHGCLYSSTGLFMPATKGFFGNQRTSGSLDASS